MWIFYYTEDAERCHMGEMPHGRDATCERCHMGEMPHGRDATCERCHMGEMPRGRDATWERCHMEEMPHGRDATWERCHMDGDDSAQVLRFSAFCHIPIKPSPAYVILPKKCCLPVKIFRPNYKNVLNKMGLHM